MSVALFKMLCAISTSEPPDFFKNTSKSTLVLSITHACTDFTIAIADVDIVNTVVKAVSVKSNVSLLY